MKRAISIATAALLFTFVVVAIAATGIAPAHSDPQPGTPSEQFPTMNVYNDRLGYTVPNNLSSEAIRLGFTEECPTGSCGGGHHLVSDDPCGCATGKDCLVYRDGAVFQVPKGQ